MTWLRRNLLTIAVAVLFCASFTAFTWAEWHYFIDQARTHGENPPSFWSAAHLHDWLYNAAANWQSELLFGVLLVTVALRIEGSRGKDKA